MYTLLDLFCGAGGAAWGYYKAGFEVIGIDKNPQKNYPFDFIQYDAIQYIKELSPAQTKFSAIHASPPCQNASNSTAPHRKRGKQYIDLIPDTRKELSKFEVPTVIENVSNADIRPDLVLYGYMFGLKVIRKRKFEINNCFIMQPGGQKLGSVKNGDFCSIFGKGAYKKSKYDEYPKFRKGKVRDTWSFAMGIEHYMSDIEISQSIPPAYTHYIGMGIINYLKYKK